MGREASAANRLVVEGKRVRLEYDVERKDKYSLTLAYVWIGYERLGEAARPWGKAENWRIAREMGPGDLEGTDLGQILESL